MAYEGRRKAREGAGNADGAIADKIRVNDLRNTTTDISKERMMKEYLQTGTQNLSKEDLETAIEDFGMALAFKPNSPAAYFGIGTALLELEDYEGAIHNFSKAIKFGMKDAQVFHSRGLSNYHLGNLQQAIADQTRAIKRDPSLESAHYCRGRAYHDSGKFRAAIRDYDTTLKLAPHNTVVYYYRGQAKRDLGDYKSAIQDFTLLIESDPTCAEYYSQRAQTMYRWAMSKSKIADQLELIADIGAPERQKWLSKERVSRLEAALADSDKAILLEPSAEASYNRSLVNFRLNRLDAALADCKTAVGLEPDFADAWHNLGCVMYKLGSMQYSDTLLKEAMAAFDNAIKYKETLAGAYYLRSKLREKFGDEKGAQEDTMQALTRKILGDAGWDDASVADVLRGRRA
ncbi:MAG: tetratricopeptide repeat protein [Candidatus Burarchaeum sp.]|nr:tetratricopeptide repeat protein [Candidatus Burarchaeum sp.]